MTEIQIPRAFKEMFNPQWRFRVYWGGRGSGKSENICRALLIKGMQKQRRVLCCREYQQSINDSVHKLLSDIIDQYPALAAFYTVTQTTIRGKNGSEFIFKGLRANPREIKSMANIDECFVEEAENVSDNSWEILIPTIRNPGSSFVIAFNPKQPSDPTYRRFVAQTRDDAYVRKVSWEDNPFFTDVLRREMEVLRANDEEAFKHVWQGDFDNRRTGFVYAKEFQVLEEKKQITSVPYEPGKPVHTIWDLGWGDSTAIWFVQRVGHEWRMIDYEEYNQTRLADIVASLQAKGYVYGTDVLPHDARHKTLAAGGMSIQEQLGSLGRKVVICPDVTIDAGINELRNVMPLCWFDADKCQLGIHALKHYRYEWDEDRQAFKKNPVHDFSSHGSDAARYFALSKHLLEVSGTGGSAPVMSFGRF